MVCAYMSAKSSAVRSWMSACWKAFISFVSGPFSVSIARTVWMRSRIARASSASRIGEVLRGGDDFTVPQREGGTPLLAPAFRILVIFGPGRASA